MKNLGLSILALGVLISLAAGSASAQFQQQYQLPSSRPAISPWLNLLRSGGTASDNYYNLVRPQFQNDSGLYQLQGQTQANRNAIGSLEGGAGSQYTTGHRAGFMTQARYFMNSNSGAPTARGGTPAGVPRGGSSPSPASGLGQSPSQGLGQSLGQGGLPR